MQNNTYKKEIEKYLKQEIMKDELLLEHNNLLSENKKLIDTKNCLEKHNFKIDDKLGELIKSNELLLDEYRKEIQKIDKEEYDRNTEFGSTNLRYIVKKLLANEGFSDKKIEELLKLPNNAIRDFCVYGDINKEDLIKILNYFDLEISSKYFRMYCLYS